MIDDLRKDAVRLKKEHTEYSFKIDEINQTIKELIRDREELQIKATHASEKYIHVTMMIEKAEPSEVRR